MSLTSYVIANIPASVQSAHTEPFATSLFDQLIDKALLECTPVSETDAAGRMRWL